MTSCTRPDISGLSSSSRDGFKPFSIGKMKIKPSVPVLLLFIFALAFCPRASQSALISLTLGKQHFVDGQKPVGPGTFDTAASGEPAPFNAFIGSDPTGPNFSATWTYNYSPLSSLNAASLTLGIVDGDSKAPHDTVALFTLDGIDLASSLNTVFKAHGGSLGEYDVYTLSLPTSVFPALESGDATFTLDLQGPGLGVLGPTPFLGAGLDFSTLRMDTTVPEDPFTLVSAGILAGGWFCLRRRT